MGSQTDMISSREFQDFKAEVQQEIAKLRKDFNYKVNQTSPSKFFVFDPSAILGSDDSNQNGDVNKGIDNIEKSDFIITLLKNRFYLLEQQLIEKNAIIDFFLKQKISPTITYSDSNDDNANINDSLRSMHKDRHSSKNNPLTGERKSATILGDSLLN